MAAESIKITDDLSKLEIVSMEDVKILDESQREYTIKQCPTCNIDLEVSPHLTAEMLKYRCKKCDPSSPQNKYEWNESLQEWCHIYMIFTCKTCQGEIRASRFQKRKIHRLCRNCDPSSDTDKFYWDQDGEIWMHLYTIYTCSCCNGKIKSYIPISDDELEFMCEDCDPSTPQDKYEWNKVEKEWYPVL